MRKITTKNKRAVSLMLSYVLLVVIGLSLSIGVYIWLKKYASIGETPKCPDDVALVLQDYSCNSTKKTVNITLKNKGLFGIDGYDITGVNDTNKEPLFPLEDKEMLNFEGGRYFFDVLGGQTLKPDDVDSNVFSYNDTGIKGDLRKIGIEPFKVQEDYIILCEKAKIVQEINCQP